MRVELEQAVALNPSRLMQRDLLIEAYSGEGNTEGALHAAAATLAIAPDDPVAKNALTKPLGEPTTRVASWINASLEQYKQMHYAESIV